MANALDSIAQALQHMQQAMRVMKQQMERTDETVHEVAQGLSVQRRIIREIDKRMTNFEQSRFDSSECLVPVSPATSSVSSAGKRREIRKTTPLISSDSTSSIASSQSSTRNKPSVACDFLPAASSARSSTHSFTPRARLSATTVSPPSTSTHSPHSSPTLSAAKPSISDTQKPQNRTTSRTTSCSTTSAYNRRQLRAEKARSHEIDKRTLLGRRLLKAAHYGKAKIVRQLLDEGAEPNYSSAGKWTPLLRATAKAHAAVVMILLKRGAEVNAKNCYGFTALHIAAYDDYSGRCVSILVEAGAQIDCRNRFGRTPLHYAAESGNLAAVLELIAAGASRSIADEDQKLPFDVAHTACFRKILHPSSTGRNAFPFVDRSSELEGGRMHSCPCTNVKRDKSGPNPILRYAKERGHLRLRNAPRKARSTNNITIVNCPFLRKK